MTDKTAEIELRQLTDALSFLTRRLDSLSRQAKPKPLDTSFDQGLDSGRFGAFDQTSTSVKYLLEWIRTLPADASPKDIEFMVDNALHEAGDVWE